MDSLISQILSLGEQIRYVAVYRDGNLSMQQRSNLSGTSACETDRYEELLVNPTVLGITQARGKIDCGGLNYVLIRYGKFFQLVYPIANGHISIAIEPNTDPLSIMPAIVNLIGR